MLHWCILAFLCRLAPVFTPVLRTRCHRSMHNWNPEIWKSTSSMCILINNQSKRLELNMDKYRSRINSDQRPIVQKWIWWNSWNAHPGSPPRPKGRVISITWRESRIPDKFTQNVEVLFLLGQFTSSQSKRSTDCVSNFDPIIVYIAVCLDSRYLITVIV